MSRENTVQNSALRRRIIDASRDLFLISGFSRVTMDEIAGALGISKATLYRQFSGKEDILASAMETIKTEILAGVEGILADGNTDTLERLARLTRFMGNWLSRLGRVLATDMRRNAPGVWEDVERFRREKLLKNFSSILESGIREDVFDARMDRDLVLRMYLSLVQNFLNPDLLLNSPYSASDIIETLFKVFFLGILTDGAREALADRKISFYHSNKEVL